MAQGNTIFGDTVISSVEEPVDGFVPGDPEMTLALNEMADEAQARQPFMEDTLLEPSEGFIDLGEDSDQETTLTSNQIAMDSIAGAALSPHKTYETADEIRSELEITGGSRTLEAVKEYIASDLDVTRRGLISEMLSDPDITAGETKELLLNYSALRGTGVDVVSELMSRLAVLDNSKTEEEALVQDKTAGVLNDVIITRELEQQAANRFALEDDSSTLDKVGDFLELMLPFREASVVANAKEALGQDASILDYIFYGSTKNDVRDTLLLMSVDPARQKQAEQAVKEIIKESTSTWLNDNQLMADVVTADVIHGDFSSTRAWVDNTIGVLDGLGLIGGFSRLFKASKITSRVHPGSPPGVVNSTNPRAGSEMLSDALEDSTGSTSKTVGVEREDIVGAVMPKPEGSDLIGAPDAVVTRLHKLDKDAEEILEGSGGQRFLYDESELKATQEKAFEYLDSITGAKFRLGMTTVADVSTEIGKGDRGFAFKAVFGANDTTGWASLQGAKNAGTKVFGKEQPVSYWVRDPSTGVNGKLLDASSKEGKLVKDGEYYLKYDYTHTYDPQVVSVFGDGVVSKIGSVPYVGKYLQDAVSRFDDVIKNGALAYSDQASGLETRVLDSVSKDMLALDQTGKSKVLEAIEQGYKEEVNWGYRDLQSKFGLSPKEATAYLAYRKGQDLQWSLQNREVLQKLQRESFESLYIGGTNTRLFAKRVDEGTAVQGKSTVHVYDPATNTSKTMSAEEVGKMYEEGGSIARMKHPIYVGRDQFDMVVVGSTPFKAGTNLLKPLSRTPLSYKKGYYQRFYKDPYVVRKVYIGGKLNGTVVEGGNKEAIAFAATRGEADELAKKAIRDNTEEGVTYTHERERSLPDDQRSTSDWESMHKRGLTSSRHRGERLEDIAGLAKIEDPMQAFVRATQAVSQQVALGGWFETMKARWGKTFGDLTQGGQFPATIDALRDKMKVSTLSKAEQNRAVAIFEYIKMMENRPTPRSTKMQSLLLDMAEATEKMPKLSGVIRGASEIDPFKVAKKSAFISFIAMNPLRHFPLQASQLLQALAIEPKYILSGMMVKDVGAISAGMFGMTRGGAKIMGTSEKEFNLLMKQFKESGLPYSMDQHALMENVVTNADHALHGKTLPQKIVGAPVSLAKGAVEAGKKLGFIPGEFVNLAGHWMVARRRWARKNPKGDINSRKAQDEIGLDARQLTWSMNRAGKVGYQGWATSSFSEILSVPLQFLSVPHKAFLSMTFSKAYTREEKIRLAALNLTLFGGTSLGWMQFNDMLDGAKQAYGIDLTDKQWALVKGGIVDWGVSAALNHMVDDDTGIEDNFQLAAAMSPTGGGLAPVAEILTGFWDKPLPVAASGAFGSVASRVTKAAREMSHIVTANPEDTPQQVREGLEAFASIFSGANNYFKMQYAKKHNQVIDSHGKEIVPISDLGASMLGFGVSTQRVADHYESVMSVSEMTKDVKEMATRWYESAYTIKARNLSDDDRALEWRGYKEAFNLMEDDPVAREIFIKEITKLSMRDYKNKGSGLHNQIFEYAVGTGPLSERMRNIYMNDSNISEENKKALDMMINNISGVKD